MACARALLPSALWVLGELAALGLAASALGACGSTSERVSERSALGAYDARLEVPPRALFDAALEAARELGLDPRAFPAAGGGRIEGRTASDERVLIEVARAFLPPQEAGGGERAASRVSMRVEPWGSDELVSELRRRVARKLGLDETREEE